MSLLMTQTERKYVSARARQRGSGGARRAALGATLSLWRQLRLRSGRLSVWTESGTCASTHRMQYGERDGDARIRQLL